MPDGPSSPGERTIAVLTSGGDAPGMNAAVRAVVRTALSRGVRVFAIREGYEGAVAEGAIDRQGRAITAEHVRRVLQERLNEDVRVTILGHVQRGGTPTAFDRVLATRYGIAAADAAAAGEWGAMVALHADRIVHVPLDEVAGRTRFAGLDLYEQVARPFFAS